MNTPNATTCANPVCDRETGGPAYCCGACIQSKFDSKDQPEHSPRCAAAHRERTGAPEPNLGQPARAVLGVMSPTETEEQEP